MALLSIMNLKLSHKEKNTQTTLIREYMHPPLYQWSYELPALDDLPLRLLLLLDENIEQKPQPADISGEGGSNVWETSNRPPWLRPPSDALRFTVAVVAATDPSRWSLRRSSFLSSLRISPLKNLSFQMSPDDPCLLNDVVDLCNAIVLFFVLCFVLFFFVGMRICLWSRRFWKKKMKRRKGKKQFKFQPKERKKTRIIMGNGFSFF